MVRTVSLHHKGQFLPPCGAFLKHTSTLRTWTDAYARPNSKYKLALSHLYSNLDLDSGATFLHKDNLFIKSGFSSHILASK